MIKRELNIFKHALMFYSRIPIGRFDYNDRALKQSFRYFPLVGIVVGVIGGGVFWLMLTLLSQPIAALIAMMVMVLLTGALHEDGFGDCFDGFGGGQTKEQVMRIMRDHNMGVYASLALIFLIATKWSVLATLDRNLVLPVLIAAHSSSRLAPIVLMNTADYCHKEDGGKASHADEGTDKRSTWIAVIIGLLPFLFLNIYHLVGMLLIYGLITLGIRQYSERRIGGYTGDVLGALQQSCELAFLLIASSIHYLS